MRTEEIKIYKFEELSEEVQNEVLERERDRKYNHLDEEWDWMEDNFKEYYGEHYGITIEEVYWDQNSVHSCGFTGFVSDFTKFFSKIGFDNVYNIIKSDDRITSAIDDMSIKWKYCETMYLEECIYPINEDYLQDLKDEEEITNIPTIKRAEDLSEIWKEVYDYLEDDFIRDVKNRIHNDVCETYADITSDSSLIETIEANGWEFTKEGKIWN